MYLLPCVGPRWLMHIQIEVWLLFCMPGILQLWRLVWRVFFSMFSVFCALLVGLCMCVVHLRSDCSSMPRYGWCVTGVTGVLSIVEVCMMACFFLWACKVWLLFMLKDICHVWDQSTDFWRSCWSSKQSNFFWLYFSVKYAVICKKPDFLNLCFGWCHWCKGGT